MKKLWIIPIICVLAIAFLGGCTESKTFTINQVTIHAKLNQDGSMQVAELYQYTFHGSYHGTTRNINAKVANFKAYLVANGAAKPFLPNQNDQLKTELNDHTYKIYTDSTNVTKQVLYTYTVPNVVTKYKDVAFINYRFFDQDNNTTLHHVTITYQLPLAISNQVKAYLHDYTGKATLSQRQNSFVYSIPTLPAQASTDIHFLTPPSFFPKKVTDDGALKYKKLQKKEEGLQARLAVRSEKLAAFQPKLLMATLLLLFFAIVMIVMTVFRKRNRRPALDEYYLAKLDPLYVHFLDHRLRFTNEAIFAQLLSLAKRRVVDLLVVPIAEKYREDSKFPDETIRFTMIEGMESLSPSEEYLVNWLFTDTHEGKPSFTLDSLYGATKSEGRDKLAIKENQVRAEKFRRHMTAWKDILKKEATFDRKFYKSHVPFFPLIVLVFTLPVMAVINHLYTIDAMSSNAIVGLNVVLIALLILGFVIYSITNRWKIGFYVYFTFAFFSVMFLHENMTIVLGLFFVAVMALLFSPFPSERWVNEKEAERAMIQEWKKQGVNQHSERAIDPATFEGLLYLSIVLKVTAKFIKWRKDDAVYQELEEDIPLLQYHHLATNAFVPAYFIFSSQGGTGNGGGGFGGGASSGGGGAGAF